MNVRSPAGTSVKRLTKDRETVGIGVVYAETELRARIKVRGGEWDPQARLGRISRGAARQLGVLARMRELPRK